eukprot:MONOS_11290.1-p1 / transcript=MONOS_11290.1 / gene=MONOS_11290 / organism=Monocercomonoides_exilis_PA203 / gene_product= Homotypic fusion and vacuole protein sorting (HOPS) complex component Vps16B / transcript_product= Homotypic fusion and vacuole protein sorting (HOPS) complex component Vps16B / location=Mono_scaffold00559:12111-15868(-) / protein_length=778 / sequence_SO=supercontig / SO=protein_coding / is_pseudo=false
MFHEIVKTFNLCQEILSAVIAYNTVLLVGEDLKVYEIKDASTSRVIDVRVAKPILQPPVFMCPSIVFKDNKPIIEAFFNDAEGTIYQIGAEDVLPLTVPRFEKLLMMCTSPDGQKLAVYYATGYLRIFDLNDTRKSVEFRADLNGVMVQLCWCSNIAVCLVFRETDEQFDDTDTIALFTLDGKAKKMPQDTPVFLSPECDGVRIYRRTDASFLSPLHRCVSELTEVGTMSPGALLLETYQRFHAESAELFTYLTATRKSLDQGIRSLINAAGFFTQAEHQITLMQAAAFGRSLDTQNEGDDGTSRVSVDADSNTFASRCSQLRVANALRSNDVQMPATMEELRVLNVPTMIDRLSNRHKHLIACRICDFLRISREPVLIHWARAKIASDPRPDNNTLVAQICKKFASCPTISFAKVARDAAAHGEREIAAMLLDYETNPVEQVKTLLAIDEPLKAIQKASQSGNLLLMFRCIFKMRPRLTEDWDPNAEDVQRFVAMVTSDPAAIKLFLAHCRRMGLRELELYKLLQYNQDNRLEVARAVALHSYEKETLSERKDDLELAASLSEGKGALVSFLAKQFGLHSRLLEEEEKATVGLLGDNGVAIRRIPFHLTAADQPHEPGTCGPNGFVDMSLRDFLFELICQGEERAADGLADFFKMSQRRYAWIKVQAYSLKGKWDLLEKIAKEKKFPVGMEQLTEICLRYNQPREALKYAEQIPNKIVKCELLFVISGIIGTGKFTDALEAAKQVTNMDELRAMSERLTNPQAQNALKIYVTANSK